MPRVFRAATVVAAFCAVSLVHLWPLTAQLGAASAAHRDAILNASLFGLLTRQLLTAPWRPFDVNMYFPFRHALAAMDHQISSVLLVLPFTWSFGPLIGHNLFIVISFIAAGVGTCRLVRTLGGSLAGGLLAGVVFAFSPFRLSHLMHAHVLAGCWLPWLFLSAHRTLRNPTWPRLFATLGWFLVLGLASWYLTVIAAVGLAALVAVQFQHEPARMARAFPRAALVCAFAAALLVALAWPYVTLTREFDPPVQTAWRVPVSIASEPVSFREQATGGVATVGALWDNSASLESYVAAGTAIRAWWLRPLARFGTLEGAFFPGVVALVCAVIGGLTWGRRVVGTPWLVLCAAALLLIGGAAVSAAHAAADTTYTTMVRVTRVAVWVPLVLVVLAVLRRRSVDNLDHDVPLLGMLAIGVVGWLLSLGPEVRTFGVSLGAGLYPSDLPPFNLLRAPARFGVLSVLTIAVFAGIGMTALLVRIRSATRRTVIAGVILLGAIGEMLTAPVAAIQAHTIDPTIYTHLTRLPAGPLIEFPIHDNLWPLLRGWEHRAPLVNGSGAREPTAYAGLHGGDDLTPDMVEHVRTYFQARYALVDFSLYSADRRSVVDRNIRDNGDGLQLIAEHGDARLYEIRDRSYGPRITRVFAGGQLSGRKGLFIEGKMDDTSSADVAPRVAAWVNGTRVEEWDAGRLRERSLLFVPLPPQALDIVTLELVSDYKVTGEPSPIGRTNVSVRADIWLHAAPERTEIRLNGNVWVGEKGYTVARIDADGNATDVRNFNTSWSADDASALAEYLRAVPSGQVVVVASTFDVSRALSAEAVDALRRIGFSADLRGRFGWAHCGIGVAGAAPGTALEVIGESVADCRVGQLRAAGMTVTRVQPF